MLRRVERLRIAEMHVQQTRRHRHRNADDHRSDESRARRLGLGRSGRIDIVEHPPLELRARLRVLILGQCTAREIALELGELIAIDRDIRICERRLGATAGPQQRQDQHQHGGSRERYKDEPEGGHGSCVMKGGAL